MHGQEFVSSQCLSGQIVQKAQLDVPNYLRTTDERMINQAWSYYGNIKKTATHITESGDKEKTQLFKHLKASIEKSIVS